MLAQSRDTVTPSSQLIPHHQSSEGELDSPGFLPTVPSDWFPRRHAREEGLCQGPLLRPVWGV